MRTNPSSPFAPASQPRSADAPLTLQPWPRRIAQVLIVGLAAVAFWPALGSGFTGDDWGFIALSRHLDSPLALYTHDHSSSYFYRPHTMLLWWLSVAALGLQPAAHMALNLILHAANALLLSRIVATTTRREGLGIVTGALFALHPAAIGTALWLSDRFDLLATAATLWAILSLEHAIAGTGRRRWVILAAILAAGAKETAIILPLVVATRLLVADGQSRRWRIATLAGVGAPFVLLLLMRALLLQDMGTTLKVDDMATAAVTGIWNWIARAPGALYFAGHTNASVALFALTALGVGWLLLRRSPRERRVSALALVGIICGLAPALFQWPVTQLVLGRPESLANPANLRFFYLTLSGCLMVAAAAVATVKDRRILALLTAAAIAAGVAWLPAARAYAESWAADSAGPDYRAAVAAGRLGASLAVERGCRLHLLGTAEFAPRFVRYADAAMKAQVPRAAALLDCIVTGERSPWFSITDEKPCLDAHWQPLVPARIGAGIHGARGVGNLCYHYFADPPPREKWNDPASRWFQYDGAAFHEISAAPPSPPAPPSLPAPPALPTPPAPPDPPAPPATTEMSVPRK